MFSQSHIRITLQDLADTLKQKAMYVESNVILKELQKLIDEIDMLALLSCSTESISRSFLSTSKLINQSYFRKIWVLLGDAIENMTLYLMQTNRSSSRRQHNLFFQNSVANFLQAKEQYHKTVQGVFMDDLTKQPRFIADATNVIDKIATILKFGTLTTVRVDADDKSVQTLVAELQHISHIFNILIQNQTQMLRDSEDASRIVTHLLAQSLGASDESVLPTLIFFENHEDDATRKLLIDIFPKLKDIGYNKFLNENHLNMGRMLLALQAKAAQLEILRLEMAKRNLNMLDSNDRYIFAVTYLTEPSLVLDQMDSLVARAESDAALLQLLNYLNNENIGFAGIDLPIEDFPHPDPCHPDTHAARNHYMSNNYLKPQHASAIACNGLGHLKGIQNGILKDLSLTQANQQFCFFYPYAAEARFPLESKIRNQQVSYPLELIQLDTTKLTQSEIENKIFAEIQKRCPTSIQEHDPLASHTVRASITSLRA